MNDIRLKLATKLFLIVAISSLWTSVRIDAAQAPPPQTEGVTKGQPAKAGTIEASRGLAAEVTFQHPSTTLIARADQTLLSPMLVRLKRTTPPAESPATYKIEFLGSVTGEFDLRHHIEEANGTAAANLPPLLVQVVSNLPEKHGSDLFDLERPGFRLTGHYTTLLVILGITWLLVPVALAIRKHMRRKPPAAVIQEVKPPTLADQLRILITRAMSAGLSVGEQGRLELLLLSFWRQKLGLEGVPVADAIARLRTDPKAGELLVSVERWLHGRGGGAPLPEQELARLLEPYRNAASVNDSAHAHSNAEGRP